MFPIQIVAGMGNPFQRRSILVSLIFSNIIRGLALIKRILAGQYHCTADRVMLSGSFPDATQGVLLANGIRMRKTHIKKMEGQKPLRNFVTLIKGDCLLTA